MPYQKYKSFLYQPPKSFHKMNLRELCDFNKLTLILDKLPLYKISKLEKLSEKNRKKKIKKMLRNRKMTRRVCRLKKSTKRKTKKLHLNEKYFLKIN